MITVGRWTGREAKALRLAKRMSLAAFAAHLGITERALSNWESKGKDIVIREVNQAALDTSLKVSDADVKARFASLLDLRPNADMLADEDSAEPQLLPIQQRALPTDGKQMALVDSGTFLSGEEKAAIWLPAFYMDVFPVTNREYMKFVAATSHQAPDNWPKAKCPDSLFDHPVTFVTWHDAKAYATWAGKDLPSAQQWEKAARGPRGDTYPWGNQKTPAKCNVRESGIGATTPVNRYHSGVSQYGIYDLCGNAWEWCNTRTTAGRYHLKGGAFTSPFIRAAPELFNDADSTMLDDDTGFRCTVSISSMERAR